MARLFDELVARSRLSPAVAPFTLSRLLLRAWVMDRDTMTAEDLLRALPHLEDGLRDYLDADALAAVMDDIRQLTRERAA